MGGTLARCQFPTIRCLSFSSLLVEGGFCLTREKNCSNVGRAFSCLAAQRDSYPPPVISRPDYMAIPFSHNKSKQNIWITSMNMFLGLHICLLDNHISAFHLVEYICVYILKLNNQCII